MADAQLPLMPSAGPGAVGARPPWAKCSMEAVLVAWLLGLKKGRGL